MDYGFLGIGILIGGLIIWFFMRGKIALAEASGRSAGEVDRTSLTEQLKAASQELISARERLANTEAAAESLRIELGKQGRECAQLEERANRVVQLESGRKEQEDATAKLRTELADLREANGRFGADVAAKEAQLTALNTAYQQMSATRDALLREHAGFQATIAELNSTLQQERNQNTEKLALLNNAREELSNQFKALATEILDQTGKKFTEQNQVNIGQLLHPLKEKITAFQTIVEEVYVNESKDRSALGEQVKMLTELNNKLSQDAQNLTLALKGDRKAQGNWGEIILEDVLERAGLVCGQHYHVQGSVKAEDGQSYVIPDIVIHLPADRHLVIDSKMTLPDYRAFVAADGDQERIDALKRHLASTRAHMKGLCEKQYQTLYGLASLDFVVMFIPLEPAFMLAVTNDGELFHDGWNKNVLVVSPSTLLFVIRTVANLWRQEDLSRNAQEISKRGAELYDKLGGFVNDLQEVGKRIDQAQQSYHEARRKLSEGRGNVIRQAEMLKDLGVKPTKSLAAQWADSTPEESIADIAPPDSASAQPASGSLES
ncbi:MAG TPA: DNA recombination protein RmuC [Tepidisphaeraceae bacterium]|nr:DNA recombination protein RmuC [Tepidisphaeraceae bacterium]